MMFIELEEAGKICTTCGWSLCSAAAAAAAAWPSTSNELMIRISQNLILCPAPRSLASGHNERAAYVFACARATQQLQIVA